ncbi:MAG: glycosyltransferase [Bacteroidetes bacterium]|nr:glycosyltransferase [Bacteroidota bacterium]
MNNTITQHMILDRKYHFLFFGLTSFDSLPQREQALAAECARSGHRVDFIEIAPSLAGRSHALFNRVFAPLSRDTGFTRDSTHPNLRVHTPPMLPTGFRNSLTPGIDRILFQQWFQHRFSKIDFSHSIVMVMMPLWWNNFINRTLVNPYLLVYDVSDALEVQSRSDATMRRLLASEASLGQEADLITYSAAEMDADLQLRFPDTRRLFLPNAVSSEMIARIEITSPHKRNGQRPSLGYIGATCGKWFDKELMLAVADSFPECEIEIIGPVDTSYKEACARRSNIRLHGYVSHERLPDHLQRFDIALIPFFSNEITRVVNPLKLYEYSAAGLPVVAIRSAELEQYASLLYLADGRQGFIDGIRRASHEDTLVLRKNRRAFAERNTWRHRVATLIEYLHPQVLSV